LRYNNNNKKPSQSYNNTSLKEVKSNPSIPYHTWLWRNLFGVVTQHYHRSTVVDQRSNHVVSQSPKAEDIKKEKKWAFEGREEMSLRKGEERNFHLRERQIGFKASIF